MPEHVPVEFKKSIGSAQDKHKDKESMISWDEWTEDSMKEKKEEEEVQALKTQPFSRMIKNLLRKGHLLINTKC